ncbi:hypothetical protein BBO99_00004564 [Phytophthora kernoviae]|uniref:alpha-1,2-Mannosidase n=2 Tax=Phytophthora kernoviae TaxID=325452 RepID=A0A3R7HJ13_9STRA|nr:hypothetical protein G195_004971 [Phytophthora kernoviae 00238/432]KAG2525712.1 hypothetical protein JM16_004340 [Phytophthora kernoviae]KAG2527436.1 hypothetical protein JM18_003855 [Phytophthora kernoviae]RLN38246.1 hypothetical protein BBI17_004751 [Phytophthora kernoviae]RLN80347.1 hypothetical protein BBO99_00004564 [Phytophthora kernoviae]
MHISERRHLQQQARDMFYHGYHNYMEHAFPWDELKPLSCSGRRWDQRERGDLDDVLGGFSLTLVDSLDMLAVLGDREEFARAVRLVVDTVSFDRDVTVSVFESTIRVIGGLVSAHMLASPEYFGLLSAEEYQGELLKLAEDLGRRLLPAFDTPTGIPVHRINLKRGVATKDRGAKLTCPAAAGSLLVEMAYLSRLSNDSSSIDVGSGIWVHAHGGIGAGLDSFFEYLLKYHLISGDAAWLVMFNASYRAVETHVNHDNVHVEVDMNRGKDQVRARRVSALQAFWPGLQVLAGDVSGAIRAHEHLFPLWNEFGAMPELLDLPPRGTSKPGNRGTVISWARTSPLRPELIESTYHLYQATRDHKYLKMGRQILEDIRRVSEPLSQVVPVGLAVRLGGVHVMTLVASPAKFGLQVTAPAAVEAPLLLFSPEIGEGCGYLDPDHVRGKIVMVTRGTCTFAEKALRLQSAGAAGVVVINSKSTRSKHPNRKYSLADDARGLGQYVTIPVALVEREDAVQLNRHVSLKLSDSDSGEGGEDGIQSDGTDVLIGSLSPWLY